MLHNELRKDFLLDRWVVIATERARRPSDFARRRTEQVVTSACPLHPGNEQMTPPAVLLYLNSNGKIVKDKDTPTLRHKNWLVRCIPNLFPAFAPPNEKSESSGYLLTGGFGQALGHHEVLVESPNHDDHPANAELPQLTLVVEAYVDRLRDLSAKPYVEYVSIFRNHGQEAGASLTHAHSQIIAMPFVPSVVKSEIMASESYWNQYGKCAFCDLIEKEIKGQRVIDDNKHFLVMAPYASVNPLEFWIIPKRHAMNPLDISDLEKESFAETLRSSLKSLKDLVNDPPYNYGIHLSLDTRTGLFYHWHLEIYPKLAIWAGFEKSTGVYINTVTPETAAAELRRAGAV